MFGVSRKKDAQQAEKNEKRNSARRSRLMVYPLGNISSATPDDST